MPGSDQKINYQLRPSKSIERKMLCEVVKDIQIIHGNREMRYIGMGAKYFSDFLLFHNEFGISDMISIEAEVERRKRYDFNKPLKDIEMKYGSTNMILPQIENFEDKFNVVWLDYDDAFSGDMLKDVETICRKIDVGSLFLISCNASVGGKNQKEKKNAFVDRTGDYYLEDTDHRLFTNKKMPLVIRKHFNHVVKQGVTKRNVLQDTKLEYMQLLFFKYSDGAPMITIGGFLVDDVLKQKVLDYGLLKKYPFIVDGEQYFEIRIPKLTYKEIQLILKNIPLTEEEYSMNSDSYYGIDFDEIQQFQKIYRYYPYYMEGGINT